MEVDQIPQAVIHLLVEQVHGAVEHHVGRAQDFEPWAVELDCCLEQGFCVGSVTTCHGENCVMNVRY